MRVMYRAMSGAASKDLRVERQELDMCDIAHIQVRAERLGEQLRAMVECCGVVGGPYLVETVADTAELWGEFTG